MLFDFPMLVFVSLAKIYRALYFLILLDFFFTEYIVSEEYTIVLSFKLRNAELKEFLLISCMSSIFICICWEICVSGFPFLYQLLQQSNVLLYL
jgi:hypothetical protein